MIHRSYAPAIQRSIKEGKKVIIIYGLARLGKTTLAKSIIKESGYKTLEINADQNKYIDVFSSRDLDLMKQYVSAMIYFFSMRPNVFRILASI
ncbi:MAG: AAA family ATPase [Bacteroidia bacterium]